MTVTVEGSCLSDVFSKLDAMPALHWNVCIEFVDLDYGRRKTEKCVVTMAGDLQRPSDRREFVELVDALAHIKTIFEQRQLLVEGAGLQKCPV